MGEPTFPRACEEGGHLYAALSLSARFVYVGIHIVMTRLDIVIDVIAT